MSTDFNIQSQSLSDWLSYLETIHYKSIDLGLDRMIKVAQALDLSELSRHRIITVTGTNGKGSVTNLLSLALRRQHLTCNLYNSPHLLRFNERITLNDHFATDEQLLDAFRRIEQVRRQVGVSLSFFEFTTLSAFMIFAQHPADFLILEVGMGGRYDSVNIVDADIAVITNVALDHCSFLGNTRDEIAYQKVGILKEGKTLVYGEEQAPEIIRQIATELHSSCHLARFDYTWMIHGDCFDYQDREHKFSDLPVPSVPVSNVALVIYILHLLKQLPSVQLLREILSSFTMPGRFQKIGAEPDVYVDVGHNPHAFAYLVKRLKSLKHRNPKLKVAMVIGMLRDKDYCAALNLIASQASALYLCNLYGPRGESGANLAQALDPLSDVPCITCEQVIQGYHLARTWAGEDPHNSLILVAGSFLTAEAVLKEEFPDYADFVKSCYAGLR